MLLQISFQWKILSISFPIHNSEVKGALRISHMQAKILLVVFAIIGYLLAYGIRKFYEYLSEKVDDETEEEGKEVKCLIMKGLD